MYFEFIKCSVVKPWFVFLALSVVQHGFLSCVYLVSVCTFPLYLSFAPCASLLSYLIKREKTMKMKILFPLTQWKDICFMQAAFDRGHNICKREFQIVFLIEMFIPSVCANYLQTQKHKTHCQLQWPLISAVNIKK